MGGGMARALLESDASTEVSGFDMNKASLEQFYKDATAANKAPAKMPSSQKESISAETDCVVLALVNETQCNMVCFGNTNNKDVPPLIDLLAPKSCVILTSTVTATWARKARDLFLAKDVHFVDCPMSGGPARAREGALTMMASGDEASLAKAKPVIDALGSDVHIAAGCHLYANVTVYDNVHLGQDCRIQSGAVLVRSPNVMPIRSRIIPSPSGYWNWSACAVKR